ncbi:hypothetical protein EUTSA_v10016016mg [Eutrema salsugineum]|uniref:Uncharacterized protein n=1 Tax=Eutrema salsugineum TaxID=72664 RepID=V4LE90_EUTSA|nr:hypothetical protein EUTSA_v10016016mg [Eutrema salsugineum]
MGNSSLLSIHMDLTYNIRDDAYINATCRVGTLRLLDNRSLHCSQDSDQLTHTPPKNRKEYRKIWGTRCIKQ